MGETHRLGNPPIDINLRRSARARRLSLRVSRLDGRVTLTLPRGVSEREGLKFARAREEWLRGHLAGIGAGRVARLGGSVPFEGRELPVRAGAVRGSRLEDGVLWLPDQPERAGARIGAFLKTAARDRLAARSDHHAAALGRTYGRITLRDTRSRWGSCSSTGDLMYSWRLVMAPPEVLDYVAAHEVAHLVEMNHSPAFWAVVARLLPDHAAARAWLRDNGSALHQVRFEP
ncbi:zinc metallopeptidase-like protein [Oceanicola granulosus HTCC2516]|uniref:Zinc metallopeptidase-like protein n=1 Tax=Oceanicola granulosus (strain ATCC BAA-861 / DSM 15982 / KCTC 12143 / HTCC2516) TaxID=314256 RepID=Q2CI94_OCEGH|nr:SprT family zinc-dependent metalloprotease [Oceanicola granulosus]EAR52364.1 zinc metallopeptidase-like protein [Oceanicola granulosus HTCC2516]